MWKNGGGVLGLRVVCGFAGLRVCGFVVTALTLPKGGEVG